jgi:hypothetical protein
MDEACRINPSPDTISIWHPGPSERARLLLAQGRVEEAARWTEERGLRPEDEVTYAREQDHLVLARVLLPTAPRPSPEPASATCSPRRASSGTTGPPRIPPDVPPLRDVHARPAL